MLLCCYLFSFVLGASLGTGVVSRGLCVNTLRLEQFYKLPALSMMTEMTQGTIVAVASGASCGWTGGLMLFYFLVQKRL